MQKPKTLNTRNEVVFKLLDQTLKPSCLTNIKKRHRCICNIIGVIVVASVCIGLILFVSLSDSARSVRCRASDMFNLEFVECMKSDTLGE